MQVQVVSNKKVSMVPLVDACQGDVQGDPRPDEDDGQVEVNHGGAGADVNMA